MQITNNYGLPGAIVEAIKNDSYDGAKADISVTALLDPPQKRQLTREHYKDITEDASNMLWALMGQAMHTVLERSEKSAIVEQRYMIEIDGRTLSGKFDRMTLRQKTLQDYKFASVWELINGHKAEREQQLNVLAEILYQNGFQDIEHLEIVHLCRDWSKSKAKYDARYPQQQIMRVEVELWPREQRLEFIRERMNDHFGHNGSPRPCSDDEIWLRGEKWAVMKKGRKSAVKLYDDSIDAETHAGTDAAFYVEHRKGEAVRCENYCSAAPFCNQFQSMKED